MNNKHRAIVELSDAELDLVTGGCVLCGVLIQGNGDLNFNAQSPGTPAANLGLSPPKNGAFVVPCITP